jgi:CheY-like chemotaxis protein
MQPTRPYIGPMLRVLIVDDYADAREVLGEYLRMSGFETDEAANGEEAIFRARAERPDVILMDLAMPEVDGIVATTELKADPRTADIPVIAVTGQLHHPSEASELGADFESVLLKPVAPTHVVAEIERVLGGAAS